MAKVIKGNSLAESLTKKPEFVGFSAWCIGDTPLICHAWSEKARRAMLAKQTKAPKAGRETRNPDADFVSSYYEMGDGVFGFPATGIKKCILSAAHKDKNIARVGVMRSLWLDAEMIRVRPALAGAICDMPLVRIYGTKPEMREDMVRLGGISKSSDLAYRAQFTHWAFKITGRYNSTVLNQETLAFLISDAGMSCGLGDWRNEKGGMFGAFHLGSPAEEIEWNKIAAGGKFPKEW